MSKKNILVLGSKPGSMLPNIKVEKIYTANGAAEKAQKYLDRFPNTPFTAVIGGREFEMNNEVQKRVVNSDPDLLISRSGSINFKRYKFNNKTNYEFFSTYSAIRFQSKFFRFGIIDIFLAELKYEYKILNKFFYILKHVKNLSLSGASTGFFSILYALKKNPECNIIIAGIGMMQGGHFYDKDLQDFNTRGFTNRANVDRKLILNLKKIYKDRIYTLDKEVSVPLKINFFESETF